MPRGPSRGWKRPAPHTERALPFIRAALAQGYDIELPLTDLKTIEECDQWRRGLHNAATLLGVSLHTTAVKDEAGYVYERSPDGTYTFAFAVHKKGSARKHHLQKHGADRTKWPYNPRARSPRDQDGTRLDV